MDSVDSNRTDAALEGLDRVKRVFAEHPLPGAPDLGELHAAARRRALAMLDDAEDQDGARDLDTALLFYASEMLAGLAIELAAHREAAGELIARLVDAAELPHAALAREVVRTPSLLGFPPAVGIEVQLGLLMAFAPLRDVSLWMADHAGGVHAVSRAGDGQTGPSERDLARQVLGAKAPLATRGPLVGLAIKRWEENAAALIARPERRRRERCMPVLEEATSVLGAILERETLISRNVTAERTLAQIHERRLTRLGFDIHDGPLQDLALLGEDVQLLRRQLSDVLERELREIMLGRVDDLDAQLVALESNLRRISASLQSPLTGRESLAQALADMAGAFTARSGIEPELRIEGDLENLTDSQQMALLSIVREALSNVREHSQASEVAVSVTGGPMSIELHIADNGIGFDVEQTLVRAARNGRFGLVGLHERARLLGGASHIDSGPGRPTTISVTLPRWRAVAPEAE